MNALERPTLVLNRNWQPIHVTTVVRALVMLWNDIARVVEPDEYRLYTWEEWAELEPDPDAPCIRSARARLRVPEVVCLARYDRLPLVGGDLQPPQRGQARPPHLPVLRRPARTGSGSPSTTSSRARRGACRAGPTAWPPASRATPARRTGRPSRPACTSGVTRLVPSGSRSTPRTAPGSRAGRSSWPASRSLALA